MEWLFPGDLQDGGKVAAGSLFVIKAQTKSQRGKISAKRSLRVKERAIWGITSTDYSTDPLQVEV